MSDREMPDHHLSEDSVMRSAEGISTGWRLIRPGVFRVRRSTEIVHLQMGPQMPHPELAGLYRKFARSERRQSSAVVRPEIAPAARAVALRRKQRGGKASPLPGKAATLEQWISTQISASRFSRGFRERRRSTQNYRRWPPEIFSPSTAIGFRASSRRNPDRYTNRRCCWPTPWLLISATLRDFTRSSRV